MKNKYIFILILLLMLHGLLFAQVYDEKKVLMQQANQFLQSKQYGRAELIWKELISKYSDDADVVTGAFNYYISLNKREDAKIIIDLYGSAIPEKERLLLEINYYLIVGEDTQADSKMEILLNKYKSDISLYGIVARLFEMRRYYNTAIKIYKKARVITHDNNQYTYELANSLRMAEIYDEAILEYVKLIRINDSYFYASKNHILEMLKIDSGLITKLRDAVKNDTTAQIQEIYANALMQIKDYSTALEVYKKLDYTRLLYFANEQFRTGNDSLAALGYSALLLEPVDPLTKAQVMVSLAKSYINLLRLDDAAAILKQVADDETLQSNQMKYRCPSNQEAREMLARLALIRGSSREIVISYLEDAKNYSMNGKSRNNVEQSIIYYLIMYGDFTSAKQRLSTLIGSTESGTDTFKQSYYYSYLLALNTEDAAGDSLLTELIIQIPTSPDVNDALYLADISGKVKGEQFLQFMEAWRLSKLYKLSEATAIYLDLFSQNPNEEFLLAAADCYLQLGQIENAKDIYEKDFTDKILGEFAVLQLSALSTDDPSLRRQLIVDFLTKNPTSALAPEFRRMLNEK
ncbi:MAG: hypothetical protein JXR56_09005 [Candidatus Cloacimonetes bacterium]|nr:hypothetical protein [Candidatus Cloacimonadota bacterium]